jgi:arylsulfatase A-like enzyme
VLFTSDNGGDGAAFNGPLRGAKGQLFEGGVRVPLIARWPGRFPKGAARADFCASVDLLPTFLSIAGASPPAGVKLDGNDISRVLEGSAASPRKEFFWQYREEKAARVGQWKWVEATRGGGLFDLAADIGEKRDLSPERPDIVKDLRARWAAWRKEMDDAEPRGPFRDY